MAQSLDGVETAFTWDQALEIPQVLATSDGVRSLYGLGRLGVEQSGQWYYPQGDALGSVRQWTDALAAVLGTQSYSPFGEPLSGLEVAPWGFTGEWHDPGGLVYLRARWYNPYLGRLTQPDTAAASRRDPQTLNRYTYANNNPLRYTDPTGRIAENEAAEAELILDTLARYGISVRQDWGREAKLRLVGRLCIPFFEHWNSGYWSLEQLREVEIGVLALVEKLGGEEAFRARIGSVEFVRVPWLTKILEGFPRDLLLSFFGAKEGAHAEARGRTVHMYDEAFKDRDEPARSKVVHELAHVWDQDHLVSQGMRAYVEGEDPPFDPARPGKESEYWAYTVQHWVYPVSDYPLGPKHQAYVEMAARGDLPR